MTLEEQVCSLELAKKLKELGVRQDSIFAWARPAHVQDFEIIRSANCQPTEWENRTNRDGEIKEAVYSAFTVAELGEMLRGSSAGGVSPVQDGTWQWQTVGTNKDPLGQLGHENTEADARAKMLIYLIENKLLETHSPATENRPETI